MDGWIPITSHRPSIYPFSNMILPTTTTTTTTISSITTSTTITIGNKDALQDRCTWEFNRASAYEAHLHGFAVFDRGKYDSLKL